MSGGDTVYPWSTALPKNWSVMRLDAVTDVLFSNVDKHTREGETPVRLCNYVDVYKNERITGEIEFMAASAEAREIATFQIRRGDVLATKDSETPDDIAIPSLVADDLPGVLCGYHLAMLRPRSKRLNGAYLAWVHASKQFRAQYESVAVGVTRFGLPQHTFRSARIPLPPLSEQVRIADFLDQSCAGVDRAMAAKRRQIAVLEGVRRDAIQQAVTRGIDPNPKLRETGNVWFPLIPHTWELVSLKRISELQTGLTLGKEYTGPLIERPYLRVANVQDGHVDLSEVTTIEVPSSVAARVELRPGDVLMTEGGDLDKLGRGTIWHGEVEGCLHQNHVFAIRCFPHKLTPRFLAYLTASSYGRGYFEATGKKTTNLASTNSTKVGLFPIPRPSVAEQERITEHLDGKLADIDAVVRKIEAQIEILSAFRNSLIHECVTGQRRVTERGLEQVSAYA